MSDYLGGYKSQSTRALASIDSTKYPDTNKDFEANVMRLNEFVDYISQYLQTMQKGVDQANRSVLEQIQDFASNLGILFAGGDILNGLDFGDLQYFLPALGALFGFDANTPFPINLLEAAEHFLLGYVIPLDAFPVAIGDIIDGWLRALGVDDTFRTAFTDVMAAIGNWFGSFEDLLMAIQNFVIGLICSPQSLIGGPFALFWNMLSSCLGGFDPTIVGRLANPVLDVLAPWLEGLAAFINWSANLLESIANNLDGFSEDVQTLFNFAGMFNMIEGFFGALAQGSVGIAMNLLGAAVGGTEFFLNIFAGIPIVGDIVRAITGIIDGGYRELSMFFANLFNVVPVGSLTNNQPNLLRDSAFGAGSMMDAVDWSIDLSDNRTNTGDGKNTGSLKLVCDGMPHSIRSGLDPDDYIKVTGGQELTASISIKAAGFISSGNTPVLFQIVPFIQGAPGDPYTLVYYLPSGSDVLSWPGHTISGTYDVPDGVTGVQLRIHVTEDALGGTLHFDDASLKLTGLIKQDHVSGLGNTVDGIFGRIQTVINVIFNAFTGQTNLLTSIEELALALINIPFGNILGVTGPGDIGTTIMEIIRHQIGGLVGVLGDFVGLADVFNVNHMVSSAASLGAMAFEILGIRNNTPVFTGLLPSSECNFPINGINTTLNCTQGATTIATFRLGTSKPLGVVSWLGYGTTNITSFYVNIFKIATNGDWTLVHHSPDIIGSLAVSATPQWNFYELENPLPGVAGDQYAFELVPVGAGTHHVRGIDNADQIPDHPYANIVNMGATRNNSSPADPASPPATITKANVTRSSKVPWIETAIDTGNLPGYYDPVTLYLTGNGTVPIPEWADYIEAIAVGGGGGGREGGTLGLYGEGGDPGKWAAQIWERGVHFDNSVTVVTVTVGTGGAGGNAGLLALLFGAGAPGTASTISIPGHLVSAAGGAGGTDLRIGQHTIGAGPGNYTLNEQLYMGGVNQNVYGSGGCQPAGGGAGGNWLTFQPGGPGAQGACWLRFRQGAIDNGDTPDNTPPTAPYIVVENVTSSTVLIEALGATDE